MKLNNCPFHNLTLHYREPMLEVIEDSEGYFVRCNSCQARGPREHTRKEARQVWNKLYGKPKRRQLDNGEARAKVEIY